MVTLRDILPAGWARGLQPGGLADRELHTDTTTSFERLQMIWCQMEAYTMLVEVLLELGLATADTLPSSLHEAIAFAQNHQIMGPKDAGIFRALNRAANSTKHDLLQAKL